MPKQPADLISFKLRMPEALRAQIENAAEDANRSMNSEILWRLGQSFAPEWQAFIEAAEKRDRDLKEMQAASMERLMANPRFQAKLAQIVTESLTPKKDKRGSD
jgi:hypothetical protein